jgi:hypothetical protein
MNFNKITGLVLLFLGLGIIFYSLYVSFDVFTGKSQPPAIFSLQEVKIQETKKEVGANPEETQTQLAKDVLSKQLQEMIPADYLQKTFNLVTWSIFIGILVLIGSNIAGLGIKLLTTK